MADDAHFGAQIADGLDFVGWHQLRKKHGCLHAQLRSSVGHRPAVIAGGGRNHAASALFSAECGDGIAGAAQLEAAGGLQGFEASGRPACPGAVTGWGKVPAACCAPGRGYGWRAR
ncbi:hypothetical protein PPS11_01157 [Pseudomonas putida S11]|nr:hypothetical protein PPS11_01157 [Pseudomonas putida S11]